MSETAKPIPDVECLKYHGTPEKPDIKIFVSHRIDLDSVIVDNPLYIPVRCGAIYDERENVTMLGDDTGDNISDKRLSFCEYTVMYWAWKNIKADYYGLCHYRRYVSFLDKDIPGPALKQGLLDSMSQTTLQQCGLFDEDNIREKIVQQEAIVPYYYYYYIDEIPDKSCKSIKENWLKYHECFLQEKDFDQMLTLIKEIAPSYYDEAVDFVNGQLFCGFNCFVMKRDMFNEMCEFMFPIMFAFANTLDTEHYSSTQSRAVGYLGEWLFSIFVMHQKNKNRKIQERQILAFQDTSVSQQLYPYYDEKEVPIVFTATDYNRPEIAVQIQSILEHADKKYKYDFIILYRGYDEDKWNTQLRKQEDLALQQMVETIPYASIRFYNPKDDILDIDFRLWNEPIKEHEYYLLFLPWILRNFQKVIYLQDGILLEESISALFNTDLEGKMAAAVKDVLFSAHLNGYTMGFKQLCEKKLGLDNLYNYVSTNVVVLDMNRIRSQFDQEEIRSLLKKRKFMNATADGFNTVFEHSIVFLPQKWNKLGIWGPDYYYLLEYYPEDLYKDSSSSKSGAVNIFGNAGQLVPQQSKEMRLFWSYAKKTPFYEELLFSLTPRELPPSESPDLRAPSRKAADKLFPPGSIRRFFVDTVIPEKSGRRKVCKKMYYFLKKQSDPMLENNTETEDRDK